MLRGSSGYYSQKREDVEKVGIFVHSRRKLLYPGAKFSHLLYASDVFFLPHYIFKRVEKVTLVLVGVSELYAV